MNWTTVRNAGKCAVSLQVSRQKGYSLLNLFLSEFLVSFVDENRKFYQFTGDWVFTYGERQVHSVVFPALHRTCSACFAEQPISRLQEDGIKSNGRLDYWAVYEDHPILFELKHNFISYRSKNVSSQLIYTWDALQRQVNSIGKKQVKDFKWRKKLVFKVGLLISPLFITSKHSIHYQLPQEDMLSILTKAESMLLPDWSALWIIKNDINDHFEVDKIMKYYPSVAFFAKVDIVEV